MGSACVSRRTAMIALPSLQLRRLWGFAGFNPGHNIRVLSCKHSSRFFASQPEGPKEFWRERKCLTRASILGNRWGLVIPAAGGAWDCVHQTDPVHFGPA